MLIQRFATPLVALVAASAILWNTALLQAQTPADTEQPVETEESAPSLLDGPVPPLPEVKMEPTEYGLRFTPGMANAISSQISKQMKRQYELNDEQVDEIKDVLSRHVMQLAQDTQAQGRDTFEMLIETMIANEGSFPKEKAVEFAQKLQPIIPQIEKFMTDTSRQCAKVMTLKQRMRYSSDVSVAMTGFNWFKERMKKWEEGDVEDGANLFWDGNRRGGVPEDESPEARREGARKQAESNADWRVRNLMDENQSKWDQYVQWAIIYYELDEAQQTAAQGVLKECKERAAVIMTDKWKADLHQIYVERQLTWQMDTKFRGGPWEFAMEQREEKLTKPVSVLFDELRKRIDALPTSKQRADARRGVQEKYKEYGIEVGSR